jgi:hypothetical protein
MRECRVCGRCLDESNFRRKHGKPHGYQCKECVREKDALYYFKNAGKLRAQALARHRRNRRRRLRQFKENWEHKKATNPEYVEKRRAHWRAKNRRETEAGANEFWDKTLSKVERGPTINRRTHEGS